MHTIRLFLAVIIIFSFFLIGCSDDDDPVGSGGSGAPAAPLLRPVDCPAGLAASTNPYATYAENYLSYINAITAFESYLTPAANATVTTTGTTPDTTIANWTIDSLTYDLHYSDNGSFKNWFVYLDGYDGSLLFDDRIFIHTNLEPADDSAGLFLAYPNPDNISTVLTWNWTTKDTVYTITYDNGTANSYRAVLNPDGSGSVTYRVSGANNIIVTWVADGNSGTWQNVISSQSGTWNVIVK
ncbi:MAG: hypothetical protein R3F48_17815 [Candidatus Zixiibacteriota bacterium]